MFSGPLEDMAGLRERCNRTYTEEGFIEHLRECLMAQNLWSASRDPERPMRNWLRVRKDRFNVSLGTWAK